MKLFEVRWSLSGRTTVQARDADRASEQVVAALNATNLCWVAKGSETLYDDPEIVAATAVADLEEKRP